MAYTDLACRRCGTKAEIVMLGKNILIRCDTCNSEKVNVHSTSVDQAVRDWNRRNDPNRRDPLGWLRGLFRRR